MSRVLRYSERLNRKRRLLSLSKISTISHWLKLTFLVILIGILGGLGAVVFRLMINLMKLLLQSYFTSMIPLNDKVVFVIPPIIGGFIAGVLIHKWAIEAKGHGVPEVMESFIFKGGIIRKRVAFIKILASSITIGSGGSAGREGPIAQIGASLGSTIAQLLKLPRAYVRLFVACGLAAGIAGTFNAPLGGALFALEILYNGLLTFNAAYILFSAIIGVAVVNIILGREVFISIPERLTTDIAELPYFVILGIIMGLVAYLWVRLFYFFEDLYDKIKLPLYLKTAIGGLITGLIGFSFIDYGIMGVGYEGIEKLIDGYIDIKLALMLAFLKMIVTANTIGSGGSGGVFSPSLYIGSMIGGVYGFLLVREHLSKNFIPYVLAGMAALFAGASQAPLTQIIMIPEMFREYMLMPFIATSVIPSYTISRMLLKGSSIYTLKLERRGVEIKAGRPYLFSLVPVKDLMEEPIAVEAEATIYEVEKFMTSRNLDTIPVTKNGKFIGMATLKQISKAIINGKGNLKVDEILDTTLKLSINPESTVFKAFELMEKYDLDVLPVVNSNEKIIGVVTRKDLLRAYDLVSVETGS